MLGAIDEHLSDIEELGKTVDDIHGPGRAQLSDSKVAVRRNGRRKKQTEDELAGEAVAENKVGLNEGHISANNDGTHFLPGRGLVYIKTWGCSHNTSDSEYMGGLLSSAGYSVVFEDSRAAEADVWVLNSCTVKNPSEQTFVNSITKAKEQGKRVLVAGCVPQAQQHNAAWSEISAIGVQQIDRIVEAVEETLKGNVVQFYREKREETDEGTKRKAGGARLDLPKIRKNPLIEIIPINTGCLNQCTYCKTKHARGDLGSYEPSEIISRVRQVIHDGVVEIWLTSEDTGAYGRDIGLTIIDLLDPLVAVLEEYKDQDVRLRIGMTNPPYILELLPEIARILNHPQVYKFLHVPVQAGSDKVLDDMRRKYNSNEFRFVVEYLRDNVEDITIATDVICGFPTETADDFEYTMDLVRDYQFPVLHISQFYPRPGTPAARLTRVPTAEVKRRSRAVTALFESYETLGKWVGTKRQVLVTEQAADGQHFVAHDEYYHQVLVERDIRLMGRLVTVEITKAGKHYLIGKVLDEEWDRLERTKGLVNVRKIPQLLVKKRQVIKIETDENEEMEMDDDVNAVESKTKSSNGCDKDICACDGNSNNKDDVTSASVSCEKDTCACDPSAATSSQSLDKTESTSTEQQQQEQQQQQQLLQEEPPSPSMVWTRAIFMVVMSLYSTHFLIYQTDTMRLSIRVLLVLGLWYSTMEVIKGTLIDSGIWKSADEKEKQL